MEEINEKYNAKCKYLGEEKREDNKISFHHHTEKILSH